MEHTGQTSGLKSKNFVTALLKLEGKCTLVIQTELRTIAFC